MTDSLRDRIAAVIQENLVWEAPNMSARLADAVIVELGLRQEYDPYSEPELSRHRYVTDWMSLTDDTTGDVNHD